MLCNFCQKETSDKTLTVHDSKFNLHTFKVDFCQNCNAEYIYYSEKHTSPYRIGIYTTINSKLYRWTFDLDSKKGRLWCVEEPGIPGFSPNKKQKLVKSFKTFPPNINPSNISDKIKLILMFM